jgi:hypothetical protein
MCNCGQSKKNYTISHLKIRYEKIKKKEDSEGAGTIIVGISNDVMRPERTDEVIL